MPIILRHNAALELNRVEYSGALRAKDLHDHAAFNAANPVWLGFDCVSIVHENIDISTISLNDLDGVFKAHRELFEPLNLMFMRRSAWVCESALAQRLLSHWMDKRNADKSRWADVRQFETFEAAAEWMLLSSEYTAILKHGVDFQEIARFGAAPPALVR